MLGFIRGETLSSGSRDIGYRETGDVGANPTGGIASILSIGNQGLCLPMC
jgi:hypothetical protein